MKNQLLSILTVLALAPLANAAESAIHISDFGCGMIDGNGNYFVTTLSAVVITPSGNANLKCQKKVAVPNSTGRAVVWNYDNTGMMCATNAGLTKDWQETVSASGMATLTCHSKP